MGVFALVMAAYNVMTITLVAAIRYAFHIQAPPKSLFISQRESPLFFAFTLVVVAPIMESLILAACLESLRRSKLALQVQILIGAMVISILHVIPWWPHALLVLPGFLIDAAAYVYWRSRKSWNSALVLIILIHALSNLSVAINYVGYAFRKHQ